MISPNIRKNQKGSKPPTSSGNKVSHPPFSHALIAALKPWCRDGRASWNGPPSNGNFQAKNKGPDNPTCVAICVREAGL